MINKTHEFSKAARIALISGCVDLKHHMATLHLAEHEKSRLDLALNCAIAACAIGYVLLLIIFPIARLVISPILTIPAFGLEFVATLLLNGISTKSDQAAIRTILALCGLMASIDGIELLIIGLLIIHSRWASQHEQNGRRTHYQIMV